MSGRNWTTTETNKLRSVVSKRPAWETDYVTAANIAKSLKRSPESIRWKMREMRRDDVQVTAPKILMLDIETMPIEALVWDVWKQDIRMEQIEKDWSVICWSAKWLFSPEVMGQVATPKEAQAHEDKSVLGKVWELLNEADMVVTHNGDSFDFKKLNARFFVHGMPKPMYYHSADTLKTAKEQFSFTYNKLDWISKILGIGRKIETEFDWWKECHNGSKKYLNMMLEYNKYDVNLEEEVYLRMRPWMERHMNLNLWTVDSHVPHCPACASPNIHWDGKYATGLGLYKAFRCEDCGALGRSTRKAYKLAGAIGQN